MFSPRHTGWENCCYNAEVERARAESEAEYWKREVEKWKSIAENKGYKCDVDKYEQVDKRLKMLEFWLPSILKACKLGE